jgi:hypothetical protein
MNTYVTYFKVSNIKPTYKQVDQLAKVFGTEKIQYGKDLIGRCLKKMQAHDARMKIKEILNCSFEDINIKYHGKD